MRLPRLRHTGRAPAFLCPKRRRETMPSKSYWQSASVDGARSKDAVKSWFGTLCDGMTPYKAEILCDAETDQEKKIRAFMADAEGNRFQFERTIGRKTFSVSRKRIA